MQRTSNVSNATHKRDFSCSKFLEFWFSKKSNCIFNRLLSLLDLNWRKNFKLPSGFCMCCCSFTTWICVQTTDIPTHGALDLLLGHTFRLKACKVLWCPCSMKPPPSSPALSLKTSTPPVWPRHRVMIQTASSWRLILAITNPPEPLKLLHRAVSTSGLLLALGRGFLAPLCSPSLLPALVEALIWDQSIRLLQFFLMAMVMHQFTTLPRGMTKYRLTSTLLHPTALVLGLFIMEASLVQAFLGMRSLQEEPTPHSPTRATGCQPETSQTSAPGRLLRRCHRASVRRPLCRLRPTSSSPEMDTCEPEKSFPTVNIPQSTLNHPSIASMLSKHPESLHQCRGPKEDIRSNEVNWPKVQDVLLDGFIMTDFVLFLVLQGELQPFWKHSHVGVSEKLIKKKCDHVNFVCHFVQNLYSLILWIFAKAAGNWCFSTLRILPWYNGSLEVWS